MATLIWQNMKSCLITLLLCKDFIMSLNYPSPATLFMKTSSTPSKNGSFGFGRNVCTFSIFVLLKMVPNILVFDNFESFRKVKDSALLTSYHVRIFVIFEKRPIIYNICQI